MKTLMPPVTNVNKQNAQVIAIGGLNRTENYKDGELEYTRHLSLRKYPYFTSWIPRAEEEGLTGVSAITVWDGLIYIKDRTMYIGDQAVDHQFMEGPKQFAMMQNKLVVWPDKVCVNMQTYDVEELAVSLVSSTAEFTEHALTITTLAGTDLTAVLKAGDTIRISNLEDDFITNNGWYTIKSLTEDTLTFDLGTGVSFVTGIPSVKPVIDRVIPDLAYITVQNNRLWGVDNEEQAIWSSVQGDPANFYTNKGIASDANAIPVSSSGPFTGIACMGTQVLAFKNDVLYKVLGLYPEEYHAYTYHMEGVKNGCASSMVMINDSLFYLSDHGVMVYGGTSAVRISEDLGDRDYSDASAGTDGDRYYLSCTEGTEDHMFVYDLKTGIWLEEDDLKAVSFARSGSQIYVLSEDGTVYKEAAGNENDREMEWSMEFKGFYETATGSSNKKVLAYSLKRYKRIFLRFSIPAGSVFRMSIKYDNNPWQEVAEFTRKQGVLDVPVPIRKCDTFKIKMTGKGPFTLLQLMREFSIRGVR